MTITTAQRSPDQLPPDLRARYGLDRGVRWGLVGAVILVVAFIAIAAFVARGLFAERVEGRLLAWNVVGPDHVSVTFEVRRSTGADSYCVLRAQDSRHVDVGYAVVTLPSGTDYVQQTYQLHTLAPAYVVEILGCSASTPPDRVTPPQFPPGVVPPVQPWTPEVSLAQ